MELEEGLFSSLNDHKELKKFQTTNYIKGIKKSIQPIGDENENVNEVYIFNNYKCDNCGIFPMRKVIYHCESCEDYDICENCHSKYRTVHKHDHFIKIDGAEERKKKSLLYKSAKLAFKSTTNLATNLTINLTTNLTTNLATNLVKH
jgi:hypothetical protein